MKHGLPFYEESFYFQTASTAPNSSNTIEELA